MRGEVTWRTYASARIMGRLGEAGMTLAAVTARLVNAQLFTRTTTSGRTLVHVWQTVITSNHRCDHLYYTCITPGDHLSAHTYCLPATLACVQQHLCRKLSKSADACPSYSGPRQVVFETVSSFIRARQMGYESVPKIITNDRINFFLKLQSAFW